VGKGLSFGIKLKLDLANKKMGEKTVIMSPVIKCSHQTKVEMAMVKAKKATTKEAHEVKMLAKLAVAVELGSTKKFRKMPKSEKEKTFGPFNPKSGEGRASISKEFSKGEASKDTIQMVKQLQSSYNSLKSNEEEKENSKVINIPKKPIKASKQMEEPKKAQESPRGSSGSRGSKS
jgi:hypothetical protein